MGQIIYDNINRIFFSIDQTSFPSDGVSKKNLKMISYLTDNMITFNSAGGIVDFCFYHPIKLLVGVPGLACIRQPALTFINIRSLHVWWQGPTKIIVVVSQSWLDINFYIVRLQCKPLNVITVNVISHLLWSDFMGPICLTLLRCFHCISLIKCIYTKFIILGTNWSQYPNFYILVILVKYETLLVWQKGIKPSKEPP